MKNIFGKFKMLFCIMLAAVTVAVAGGCDSTEKAMPVPEEVGKLVESVMDNYKGTAGVQQYVFDFVNDKDVYSTQISGFSIGFYIVNLSKQYFGAEPKEYVLNEEGQYEVSVELKVVDFYEIVEIIKNDKNITCEKIKLNLDSNQKSEFAGTLIETLANIDNNDNFRPDEKESMKCPYICYYIIEYLTENNELPAEVIKTYEAKLVVEKDESGNWNIVTDEKVSDLKKYDVNVTETPIYVFDFKFTANVDEKNA